MKQLTTLVASAVAALSLSAAPVKADTSEYFYFKTGQDLINLCNTDEASCINYMMGIEDEISALQFTKNGLWICQHTSDTGRELRDMVLAKINSDRDFLHWSAAVAVHSALKDAHRCKGG